MSANDRTNRLLAVDGISRRRPRWLFVVAGAAGAVLLACLFGAWLLRGSLRHDLGNRFPPGVLADYVPEDSEAVLAVNVRQLLEAPSGRKHLGALVQLLSGQVERELPWLGLAGIKLTDDIDTLFISFAPRNSEEPICLARGRFDLLRFQPGPDKLQEKTLDGFRVWEYTDRPAKRTTLLTIVGDMLVVSETPGRVQAALKQASDPQPIRVRDATLRELLMKVDRGQSLWLAASVRNLGPISGIENYLLKMVLRPLLAHAESVYGGITCEEDLQAELHFGTSTDEDADQLETDLKSLCEAAPGAALLAQQNEMQPLLRLLGAGQIRRDGNTILLRCRLPAR
jgi:hypothetical protein